MGVSMEIAARALPTFGGNQHLRTRAHVRSRARPLAPGTPPVPPKLKTDLWAAFDGPCILAGGPDKPARSRPSAKAAQTSRRCARLSSPTRPGRPQAPRRPLNAPAPVPFYTPDAKGYTDYPALAS